MGQPSRSENPSSGFAVNEVATFDDARNANSQEHELTLLQALRMYPRAVFWSLIMSTAVVMEGYDTKLIGTLFAQPAFQKAYGKQASTGSFQVSAPWQTGLSNGATGGQLIGLLMAGYLCERFGFRITMISGLSTVVALIFMTFFAANLVVLEIGQTLFGISLGMFQTLPVIYALEISPLSLRAYLTNYVNFCWAFGQILATGILRGVLKLDNEWAYRIPFAVQWTWPVILIPLLFFAPESPWWLVRRGRVQEAREVLHRLVSSQHVDFDFDKHVALMVVTTEHERTVNAETSYWACFQSANLRRTIIVIGIYCIQTLNGNPLRGYSTYFLEQAGFPTVQAFNLGIAGYGIALAGGFFSWVLLPLFGRRTIYLWSLVLMFVIMLLIGILGVPLAKTGNVSYSWAIGSLLLISSFLYNCSIGPLTNTLCAEIPSSILRSKSIALARWSYAISTIVAGVLTPYQLNPTAWNWSAKTGFFWAGGCLISIIFTFFLVPEPKDRTAAEMDLLFEKKVPARHFAKTQVDFSDAVYEQEIKTV
ncbi:general substrate transporter [Coniochaeta sp. 2T2.1]|nr:general substrate transporter [Coniochaeta sp. 2T2.1]